MIFEFRKSLGIAGLLMVGITFSAISLADADGYRSEGPEGGESESGDEEDEDSEPTSIYENVMGTTRPVRDALAGPGIFHPVQYFDMTSSTVDLRLTSFTDRSAYKSPDSEQKFDATGSKVQLNSFYRMSSKFALGTAVEFSHAEHDSEVDGERTWSKTFTAMEVSPFTLAKITDWMHISIGYDYVLIEEDDSRLDAYITDYSYGAFNTGILFNEPFSAKVDFGVTYDAPVEVKDVEKFVEIEIPAAVTVFADFNATSPLTFGLAITNFEWSAIDNTQYRDQQQFLARVSYGFEAAKLEMFGRYNERYYKSVDYISESSIGYYDFSVLASSAFTEKSMAGFQVDYELGQDVEENIKLSRNAFAASAWLGTSL